MTRRRILILVDHYVPAEKAGGPVRTIAGLVEHLGDLADFRILTRDHDLGVDAPYEGVPTGRWIPTGRAQARYLRRSELGPRTMCRLLRENHHDLLYVNSLFTWPLGILPLVLRRLRLIARVPVVLAPRGQLDPGALGIRRAKKRAFLVAARAAGLYGDLTWQATSELEAEHIREWAGSRARIEVASNLRVPVVSVNTQRRTVRVASEPLRVAFVSRISPKKNLHGALAILAGVSVPVDFDIYGPCAEPEYWEHCQVLMGALPGHVRARYHGSLPHADVEAVLTAHDLFFLPTQGENFGHVLIEALAAGCPVLASDRIPWRDLEERGAGWTIPVGDESGFRDVIEACSADPSEEWEKRSDAAYRYAADLDARADPVRRNASLLGLAKH